MQTPVNVEFMTEFSRRGRNLALGMAAAYFSLLTEFPDSPALVEGTAVGTIAACVLQAANCYFADKTKH